METSKMFLKTVMKKPSTNRRTLGIKNSIWYEITAIFAPSRNLYQCTMDTGWRLTSTGSLLENYNISYFSKCLLDKYYKDKIAHAPSKKISFMLTLKIETFLILDDQIGFGYFSLYLGHCLHSYKYCITNATYNKYNSAITYKEQWIEAWEIAPEKQNLFTWRIDQHSTGFAVLYSGRGCGISTFRSVQRWLRWRYGWRYGWWSDGDNSTLTEKFGYMTSRGSFQPDFLWFWVLHVPHCSCNHASVLFSVHTQSLKTTRFSDSQS